MAVNYTYDAVGSRKQITSSLAPVPAGLWNGVYPERSRRDANDRFTAGDTYDPDGNTVSSGGIANVYDPSAGSGQAFENHLIQKGAATIVVACPERSRRDGDGYRVSKTVAGVTTTYLVDTLNPTGYAQVVYETFSGSSSGNRELNHGYVYGLELISQTRSYVANLQSATQKIYYAYDGHGSVRALTDPTGAVTDTYDYDAFGNLIHSTGSTPNNYLFAGEQFDPDLNLYYNRARYLNVSTGRFLSMDTFEGGQQDPGALHKYLYTRADPVDFTDPSGLLTDYSPYGYAIEVRIQAQYIIDYAGNQILFGQPTGLGINPLLKPDIFDRTRKIWMDVKPMSPGGLADAKATWDLYNSNFSGIGYSPDRAWIPTFQNPIGLDNKLFFVFNVQGILFYTADADSRRIRDLKTFADVGNLIKILQQPNSIAVFFYGASIFGVGVGALITAIANTANEEELGEVEEDVALAPAA